MASKKPKDKTNGEVTAPQYGIDQKKLATAKEKLLSGKAIEVEEFNQILMKAAKDFREKATDAKKTGLEYVAEMVGVSQSSLNSYYFMSFQIMNKDMREKVHPYVAFTNALIHALNLGYYLGRLDFDKKDGPDTTITSKAKPAPKGKRRPRKPKRKK